MNKSLAEAVNEPDPNLESASTAGTSSASARIGESVTGVVSDRGRQPRTSEVFQAVGPLVVDVSSTTPGRNVRPQSVLSADSPDELPRVELTPDRLPATDAGIEEATWRDEGRPEPITVSLDASPSLELFERHSHWL